MKHSYQLIKEYLYNNGIKQSHVAKASGYNDKTLSAMLNGGRKINVDDLVRISKALGVEPSVFLPVDSEKFGVAR